MYQTKLSLGTEDNRSFQNKYTVNTKYLALTGLTADVVSQVSCITPCHGRNHHILWGGRAPPQYWKNTNLSPPIIGLLYCNMWHMICPPFMNPVCSLVDLLLLPIYFQFRKNKGNKTVWPPPSIVHLVEPVNAGLRHRLKKPLSPTVTGA